ncbi:Ig-like domain-containing protein [Arthrobacter burdickii]|uniref:Ig-like domain-containing protein n=1 Tax=Arthrobacter burdickii TaxID=3035920 RepID=A0ABT8JWT4_9MICC|nr:Ig-like domain-containing protein [Arthrobacter burdickii]MDN4609638.1 Ig-like domain-containing protein [Arthrobacter burdickii]
MSREEPGSDPGSSRLLPLFSAEGWAPFVASVLSRLYLGTVLNLALIAVLPALLGWHGTIVQSGSMEPHISAGDVVLAAPLAPAAPVPVGGVVEFSSPASAEPSGIEKTRLHRIVGDNADGTFVTAGDANADADSTPLTREQITGQARLLVPMAGLPGLWLGTGNLPALALWSVVTLFAVVMALFGGRPVGGPEKSERADGNALHEDTTGPSATAAGAGMPEVTGSPEPRPSGVRALAVRASAAVGIMAALIALVLAGAAMFSSAAFTASTANAANTFSAAADWTPPSVTITNPGPSVQGGTTLTAEVVDEQSGIRSVSIEYLPAGSMTWTVACATVAAPYTCVWDTQSVPDGSYKLRAVGTNTIGLSGTSAEIDTRVMNAFGIALSDLGEIQRGTVNLVATITSGSASKGYAVRVEYSLAGTNRWSALCANLTAPYNCSWNTTGFANDYYDLRAVAVSGSTVTYSETMTDVLVDNLGPVVVMSDPGTPLSGTRTFTATATDAHSGVAQTQVQYSRSGTTTWTTLCTVDIAPFSCRFDTTALAYGSYNFRAVATDAAGISTTSAVVSNRMVDNTITSVSVEDPGAYLSGTARLTASANSTAGISRVRIQTAPAGTSTWTTRCTVTATPYSCDWDTRATTDGLYDLRAVLTESTGRETVSATITERRVDNSPLRGTDIQAANGPGTAGTLGTGDTLTLTYSQQINPTTVTAGWNGAALPVTVRLRDGNLLGLGNTGDTIDVQRNGSTVNLGSANLKQNYAKSRRTVTLNATMTATTTTSNGVPRTVVTVTLGTIASGAGSLRTTTTSAAMIWSPAAAVTSTAGLPSSTAPVTETGLLDRDF